jgi:hypothetical protein
VGREYMKFFHAVCVKAENNVNVTSPHWWFTPPAPGHIHFEDKAATDPISASTSNTAYFI